MSKNEKNETKKKFLNTQNQKEPIKRLSPMRKKKKQIIIFRKRKMFHLNQKLPLLLKKKKK